MTDPEEMKSMRETDHAGMVAKAGRDFDLPVFVIAGGALSLFVVLALWDLSMVGRFVDVGFAWATDLFGALWQFQLLATFVVAGGIALSPWGTARMGELAEPEMSTFRWVAIIMCTLLAGGGVFWAAGEPVAHLLSPPPFFGDAETTREAAFNALAQSFMHWGFLAWSCLGALSCIVLMHLHYGQGLPLKPRTLLYPVLGEAALKAPLGALVDAAAVLAVVAGTIGPIGFLSLQVSYGLAELFGTPDTYGTHLLILTGLVCLYTASAVSGINRGIQILSRFNIVLGIILVGFIFLAGPTSFFVDGYVQGMGTYIDSLVPMALYRGDTAWLSRWTVFFWGWFLGYGPMMAIFIAKISRGRTIRELILVLSIVAPLVTCAWFTVIGGAGLSFELAEPGSISGPFDGGNLPAALLAMTQRLPLALPVSLGFLVLTTVFVATTGDSMTYTLSIALSRSPAPRTRLRVFWGVMMGLVAAVLISLGSGGILQLQAFIVITAVPVSLVLLPLLWVAPQIARQMAERRRGRVPPG
jgi:choline-glycine betaine transporter